MSLTASDLGFYFSTAAGSAGNTSAGTPQGSLGKYLSTTAITNATLNNLFDDVTGDENASGDVEYRALFVRNLSGLDTMIAAVVWLSAQVAGGANCTIGVDPTGVAAIGASSAQAVLVADENTVPAGVTFSAPTTKASALALGDIGPGFCRALWIRRTATNSAVLSGDGVSIRIECDSS